MWNPTFRKIGERWGTRLIEGLVSFLAADTGLQNLLGTTYTRADHTNGIFPVYAPDGVPMPYLVLQQVGGESLQQSFAGTGPLQQDRWRFGAYGTSYKQAKELCRAVMLKMLGCDGTLPAGDAEVHGVWLVNVFDETEPTAHGTIFGCHVDLYVTFLDLSTT